MFIQNQKMEWRDSWMTASLSLLRRCSVTYVGEGSRRQPFCTCIRDCVIGQRRWMDMSIAWHRRHKEHRMIRIFALFVVASFNFVSAWLLTWPPTQVNTHFLIWGTCCTKWFIQGSTWPLTQVNTHFLIWGTCCTEWFSQGLTWPPTQVNIHFLIWGTCCTKWFSQGLTWPPTQVNTHFLIWGTCCTKWFIQGSTWPPTQVNTHFLIWGTCCTKWFSQGSTWVTRWVSIRYDTIR